MVLLDWEVDIADGGVASDFGGSSGLAALRLRFRWRLRGAMRLLDLGRSACGCDDRLQLHLKFFFVIDLLIRCL